MNKHKKHFVLLLCCVGLNFIAQATQAAEEDAFLGQIRPQSEQTIGQNQGALWTLPLVATQYQPTQPTPAMQTALQAQNEGRFLDALILLDEAAKSGQVDADTQAEMNLLRASFLLQGNQSRQAVEILLPLHSTTQHAADARALTAMAHLQLGQMQQALETARQAQAGILSHLAMSYALQGVGHLEEARKELHDFNARTPPSAVSLAREAELALTLDQVQAATTLAGHAREVDATHPYVIAVSGLTYLIDGHAQEAKAAFETALKRDPKDAKALLGLGLAEIKLGNFKTGQEKLLAANEADPGNALILTYLGRSQQNLGQTEAARASWRSAQQSDPKDPMPWLFQAQAELQTNRPLDARDSLREAQARVGYRSVYRGDRLLREDTQVLQANLAEVQRQLGMEGMAYHTLSDMVGEQSSANLRNQADLLQGQRFAETTRRSLLLQSLFNEKPGTLPSELDIYGDGFGQTGAATQQHGAISQLGAQQASYNNYDELFSKRTTVAVDAISGSQNTNGEQVRAGVGSDMLGVSIAQRNYKTDGNAPYTNLDNNIWQGVMQWRPTLSTQAFASYQTFNSKHGEETCPADPINCAVTHQYEDTSAVTRLGLRHTLDDNSELRALLSRQQTSQIDNWEWASDFLPLTTLGSTGPPLQPSMQGPLGSWGTYNNSSAASSGELQYRRSGADYTAQWGVSSARSPLNIVINNATITHFAQQAYVDWKQILNPYWQLEADLAWGKKDRLLILPNTLVTPPASPDISTYLRSWLPKLGLVYTPDNSTHVRFAAWKNLDDAAVGGASIAPASLAGFVLNHPNNEINRVENSFALGADKQLANAWLLEGQLQQRSTGLASNNGFYQSMWPERVDESRVALHWQPGNVNVTLAYDEEFIQSDPGIATVNSVLTQHLRSEQLDLRWHASSQWTAKLDWSYNLLNATQNVSDFNTGSTIQQDVRQFFNVVNAELNWQFNRGDSVEIGVRNATNQTILYTDIAPLTPRFSQGRLTYAKVKLTW